MNREEYTVLRRVVASLMAEIIDREPACKTCGNFDGKVCEHAECEPPADVIEVGCDQWSLTRIPF